MDDNQEINLQFLHSLAANLNFEINDEQCKNLILELEAIKEQMTYVTKINTDGILPLDYPFELTKTYLREDIIETPLTKTDVLSVAPATKNDYIIINRVVGNSDE